MRIATWRALNNPCVRGPCKTRRRVHYARVIIPMAGSGLPMGPAVVRQRVAGCIDSLSCYFAEQMSRLSRCSVAGLELEQLVGLLEVVVWTAQTAVGLPWAALACGIGSA